MPKQLLEDYQGELIVDRNAIIHESHGEAVSANEGLMVIPGRLSVPDQINANGRRYPRAVWESQLSTGSTLQSLIGSNACFGQLEHPTDGAVTLASPISHMITEAYMDSAGEIRGKLRILNTADGRKLAALIEAGYNPPVSSRGFGSVVKDGAGVLVVQNDYVCEGWDCVKTPSCTAAVLEVPRVKAKTESASTVVEACEGTRVHTLCAQTEAAKTVVAAQVPNAQKNTMSLKTIKEQLSGFPADPSTLTPKAIAENLQRLDGLHAAVTEALKADASIGWEAAKLHDEIHLAEAKIYDAISETRRRLAESEARQVKLLSVLRSVAETAATYKAKLGKSSTSLHESTDLVKEVGVRGRGWRERALTAEARIAELNTAIHVLSESMDSIRKTYNEDVTALGRDAVSRKYCEELSAHPELAEALRVAKTPTAIVEARVKLTTLRNAGRVNESGKTKAPEAKAPAAKAPALVYKQSVTESATMSVPSTLYKPGLDPAEAVAIAGRMSGGARG